MRKRTAVKGKTSLYIRPILITLHWILTLFAAASSSCKLISPLSVSSALVFVLQKKTVNILLVLLTTCVSIISLEEILFLSSVLVPDSQANLPAVKRNCKDGPV